jgi:hypothetical protein
VYGFWGYCKAGYSLVRRCTPKKRYAEAFCLHFRKEAPSLDHERPRLVLGERAGRVDEISRPAGLSQHRNAALGRPLCRRGAGASQSSHGPRPWFSRLRSQIDVLRRTKQQPTVASLPRPPSFDLTAIPPGALPAKLPPWQSRLTILGAIHFGLAMRASGSAQGGIAGSRFFQGTRSRQPSQHLISAMCLGGLAASQAAPIKPALAAAPSPRSGPQSPQDLATFTQGMAVNFATLAAQGEGDGLNHPSLWRGFIELSCLTPKKAVHTLTMGLRDVSS